MLDLRELIERIYSKVVEIEARITQIEKKNTQLATACCRAFEMTKTVIQNLSEHTLELGEDLSENNGTVGATW